MMDLVGAGHLDRRDPGIGGEAAEFGNRPGGPVRPISRAAVMLPMPTVRVRVLPDSLISVAIAFSLAFNRASRPRMSATKSLAIFLRTTSTGPTGRTVRSNPVAAA